MHDPWSKRPVMSTSARYLPPFQFPSKRASRSAHVEPPVIWSWPAARRDNIRRLLCDILTAANARVYPGAS
jgi:hypothetical protein